MEHVLDWLKANSGKIILLVIVVGLSLVVTRLLSKGLRKVLEHNKIPQASIFINIARVVVWVIALTIVLHPVFGVSPASLFTALGIGGLAISLGLKDSIANTIGGFTLMFSHVIQPGDMVSISGTTGVVQDINWRQTVVRERNGNIMMIPNSVLNTTALEKLDPANECMVTIPFTAKPDVDTAKLAQDLLTTVNMHARSLMNPKYKAVVRYTGFTSDGVSGNIVAYAKHGVALTALSDAIARAVHKSKLNLNFTASSLVGIDESGAITSHTANNS
ncbi:transporter [Bifidobacterium animalis subsp. animalis]|uniref:mechanosensitive ion channel family protein n=1 Tax=Bifidobacterium animalis TaxID=28025 RepID=UPI00101F73D2|nr:mechanosensitive ion channel domain-containing protein [Bifidobacterium animalis]RYN15085.1 transporter [Bifidobacterium animalis subsp. animalis]